MTGLGLGHADFPRARLNEDDDDELFDVEELEGEEEVAWRPRWVETEFCCRRSLTPPRKAGGKQGRKTF